MWPINGFIAFKSLRVLVDLKHLIWRTAFCVFHTRVHTRAFYAPARPWAAAAVVTVICLKEKPSEARADGCDPSIYPLPPHTLPRRTDVAQMFFIWLFKENKIIYTKCINRHSESRILWTNVYVT